LLLFPVDGSGVLSPVVINNRYSRLQIWYDRMARLLYDDAGNVFDENGAAKAGFTLPVGAQCFPAMDGAGGRMFFACAESPFGLTVRSFDLASRQPLSRVLLEFANTNFIQPQVAGPIRLVRFGANGLAVASSSNWIYLYRGDFVR